MNDSTRQRLLVLNREFYNQVAEPFSQTRQAWQPGQTRLLTMIPAGEAGHAVRVIDVGCGNGRFACLLESCAAPVDYTGVDAEERLLELARAGTANLEHVQVRFVRVDIAQRGWVAGVPESEHSFDVVLCLATLQHLPGYELRRQALRDLAGLAKPAGMLLISAWQFLSSPRFAVKQMDWSAIGLHGRNVEPGDALLPWKQGSFAIRYVHQIDLEELARLTADAGLRIVETFHADGKEGNLNLYAYLARERTEESP